MAYFIDQTFDIEQWEADLEYLTVFIQVVGTRPQVSPESALQAVAAQFNLLEDTVEIYRVAPPEDFLLRVPNHGVLLTLLQGNRSVQTPAFQLQLKPWSRLANATHGALYHTVQIELEGIPSMFGTAQRWQTCSGRSVPSRAWTLTQRRDGTSPFSGKPQEQRGRSLSRIPGR